MGVEDVGTASLADRALVRKVAFFLIAAPLGPTGTLVGAGLVSVVYYTPQTAPFFAIWLTAASLVCLDGYIVIFRARRTLSTTPDAVKARAVLNHLTWSTYINSSLWGAAACYLFLATDGYQRAMTVLTICLIAAGAVPMYAPAFRALVGHVTPMILIIAATLFFQATITDVVVGVGVLVFAGITLLSGKYLDDLVSRVFRLSLENEELLAETRATKAEVDRAYERYRDVQEAARMQLELRAREAEAADRDKSRFIARASHDLRQPMSALQNFLEVARHWHGKSDFAQVGSMLERMNSSVSVLSRTFSQILDIAKYESGEYKPNLQSIDLRQVLRDIEDQFGTMANAKGLEFRVRHLNGPPYLATSDYEMLWRVLSNLVANAIKFTPVRAAPRRSAVLVGATRIGNRFRINVFDTGVGVPKESLGAIWEPFYQVMNQERGREKGLGLGLSIVRAACESLGHEIEFRSIEDRGSRFSIGVPVGDLSSVEISAGDDEHARDRVADAFVLLLEDDHDARESQEALMKTWGARFVSGSLASEVLGGIAPHDREPDAILTDFRLSETETGADAIAAIRTHYDRCIPAIVVTGDLTRPADALDGLPKVRLLHKPVKPSRLKKALNDLLS